MNYLDWGILIVIAFAAFKGFKNGFIREIIGTIALVLGVIACFALVHKVNIMLAEKVEIHSNLIPFVSYVVIFLVVVLATLLLGYVLNYLIKLSLLGIVNRVAGLFLSSLKYLFMLSLLIWLFAKADYMDETLKNQSFLFCYVEPVAPKTITWITKITHLFPDLIENIENFFTKVEEIPSLENSI